MNSVVRPSHRPSKPSTHRTVSEAAHFPAGSGDAVEESLTWARSLVCVHVRIRGTCSNQNGTCLKVTGQVEFHAFLHNLMSLANSGDGVGPGTDSKVFRFLPRTQDGPMEGAREAR